MFGQKKDNVVRQPPVEKIKVMSRMGIGEKEIVKQLKTEGYSFSEIENAMMQSMKEGIESSAVQNYQQPIQQPMLPQLPPLIVQQPAMQQSTGLSWPRLERPEEMFPQEPQEELSPEIAMEDLIENITFEKLENYNKQLQSLSDHINNLDEKIKSMEENAGKKVAPEIPKEYDDRLENMEAKLNGLERAFKQMLPELKMSIDELRQLMNKHAVVSSAEATPKQQIYEKYYPNVPLFPATEKVEKEA